VITLLHDVVGDTFDIYGQITLLVSRPEFGEYNCDPGGGFDPTQAGDALPEP
jgi:hypothetical protein